MPSQNMTVGIQDKPLQGCCFGILIILSLKHFKNSKCRENFFYFPYLPENINIFSNKKYSCQQS